VSPPCPHCQAPGRRLPPATIAAQHRDPEATHGWHLCALSGDAALSNINLPAGTWYVIVQTMEPQPPTLLLTVH
jgi:hypothetical protein